MIRLSYLWLAYVSIVLGSSLDKSRSSFLETLLNPSSASSPNNDYCKPTGLIQDACCDFETIEQVNLKLWTTLSEIIQRPFFRYHKVDLYRECPYWKEDGSCMNRACGVETTDEEHIPAEWRSTKLGALEPSSGDSSPVNDTSTSCESDPNFCVLEDDSDSSGQYVDLISNPERFTGYAGASSSRVWKSIYEENCFTPVKFIDPARSVNDGGSGFAPLGLMSSSNSLAAMMNGGMMKAGGEWREEEKRVLESLAAPRDGGDEVCLEKRVFYRLISGLHASISIHICDDYLDQTTGLWSPNLQCFITRVAQHPERLENVYFTYVLLLRALAVSGPEILATLDAVTTSAAQSSTAREGDEQLARDDTREKLVGLVEAAKGCENTFDETSMFTGRDAEVLKDQFKSHFRNISRIMDCVGCDKCRLWGKLQITGLGTGLKLLFSSEAASASAHEGHGHQMVQTALSRGEVVAFINTLHRFSESLHAVEGFREMWSRRDVEEAKEKIVEVEEKVEEKEKAEPIVVIVEDVISHTNDSTTTTTTERAIPIVEAEREEPVEEVEDILPIDLIPSLSIEWSKAILSNLSLACIDTFRSCVEIISNTVVGRKISVEGTDKVEL